MAQQWQTDLESWVAGWDAVRDDAPMGDYSRFEVDE
ncbi:hypothetical protein ACUXKL_000800 [Kocuria marina]